jgi:hypothetical protein
MRAFAFVITALVGVAAAAAPARADRSYAIVVGSNQGGAGQTDLRFAESDARRVGDLLVELGGYRRADITTIVEPEPDAILGAIDAVASRAAADADADARTTVFFYYSGHAKASALTLGARELALATLRERLLAIPSTLTVVVLDACQSGAFSRIKGAEPAADFSFNSKSRLDATGVAVLASSTGNELSQESDLLESSYFTHHLLVGLRGAADQSGDGRVTLDEAYRYAYNQTLLATAATAVGSQHVSLEVDLKGHGEVPLSYPQKATAQLELPAALAGDVLIERLKAETVMAELHKVAGAAVRVAVAPGEYHVIVRRAGRVERCPVTVPKTGVAAVDPATCDDMPQVEAAAKGGFHDGRRMTLAVTLGLGGERDDGYIDRLAEFGYDRNLSPWSRLSIAGRWRRSPHVELGVAVGVTASPTWTRETTGGGEPLRFSWATYGVIATARLDHRPGFMPNTRIYTQLGAGLGIGRTTLRDETDRAFHDTSLGPVLTAGVGLAWDFPWQRALSLGLGFTFAFAPVLTNQIDDRHLGVGQFLELDVAYRF